jgi:hypothetical protein
MTNFDKSKFTYHGGYLEYTGTYEGQPTYDEVYGADKIHPSRVGMPKELFIARFKYSGSPIKMGAFKKFLIKNFTVEEYVEMRSGDSIDSSPLGVLQRKGFTF